MLGLVEPHSYLVAWVRPGLTPKRRTGQAGRKGTVKKMRKKFITWSKDGRMSDGRIDERTNGGGGNCAISKQRPK